MFFNYSSEEFISAVRWIYSSDAAISVAGAICICQMVRERDSTFSQWFVAIDENTITFVSRGNEFIMHVAGYIHDPTMAFSIDGETVSPEEWVTAFNRSINS